MLAYVLALLAAGPAIAFGPCKGEIERYRAASLPVWEAGGSNHNNVVEASWRSLERRYKRVQKDKRQLMTNLYVDLKNMVKPKFAPHVTGEALAYAASSIRCVKRDILSSHRHGRKDRTAGVDRDIAKRVKDTFGVDLDFGAPL